MPADGEDRDPAVGSAPDAGGTAGPGPADADWSDLPGELPPSVEEQREALRSRCFDSRLRWRILFLGAAVHGVTDIVSCLRRALSNLGHTVLALSVTDHPDLVENLPRNILGHGPVFVRGEALDGIVERFQPQVILCVAGGLCWREGDARALQERGILLLGLTLSDPDVMPTVVDHVHRFDFHATNSQASLEEYRSRGVANTGWFPFGIDAGFVAAEAVPPQELAADVICLGGAAGRPERHRLMARLAREFKVRVYGRGWPLPGSEHVSGWRLLEAGRAGRIHVNFAATRAGFVNVKCGVFESVASGAVVCTSRFEEMQHFFRYGSEIVGFETEDELVDRIREILADPELYDRLRRRAFFRLVSEHLYEHRWRGWFDAIAAEVAGPHRILSGERAAALRPALLAGRPRPRRVVIAGFYGARNAGDELILQAIEEGLSSRVPGAEVRVAAEKPVEVERIHALPAFPRVDMAAAAAELSGASSFILGGGGLWHDYTFVQAGGAGSMLSNTRLSLAGFGRLAVLARLHGCPVHIHGLGVGPLEHRHARHGAAFLAGLASSVSVRDEASQRLLESLEGLRGTVECHADPVFAMEIPVARTPAPVQELASQHALIGVNLRRWAAAPAEHLDSVARALEHAALQHRAALIGVPMQDGESADRAVLEGVFARIATAVPRLVLGWTCDAAVLAGTLRACRVVLAMRLHACILSFRAGVSTIGLAYDPKVRNLFDELESGGQALDVGVSSDVLCGHLKAALGGGGALGDRVVARVRHLEASARAGLTVLAERVRMEPVVASPEPIPRQLDERPAGNTQDRGGLPAPEVPDAAVDLSRAALRGGSVARPDSDVGVQVSREHGWVEFQIDRNDPRQGDFAQLDVQLDHADGEGRTAVLSLLSPYCRPQLAGRIVYQVLLNGVPVLEEDVAMWDSVTTVRIVWTAIGEGSVLGVRVLALRDCEPWNWGRAGRVVVLQLSHRSFPGRPASQVFSTSPFARSLLKSDNDLIDPGRGQGQR